MDDIRMKEEFLTIIQELRNKVERGLGRIEVETGRKRLELPLAGVNIDAKVTGRVAQVTLEQTFRNTFQEPLEAVYIFPLAGNSSVSGFEMKVGTRTITGKIQERGEARQEYSRALANGKRAALVEQERDDVFTMQVGNIPPDETIRILLTYTERLQFFENGTTELRLPLVVAPRYIPGNQVAREQVGEGVANDTDEVPDASRISPPRLADGLDPNVSLGITVELSPEQCPPQSDHPALHITDLSCSQHATTTSLADGSIKVSLANTNELLNRDFVLRWQNRIDKPTSSVVLYRDGDECYGMVSLLPPTDDTTSRLARDVLFVVDRSGSMMGEKMTSAARACSILLSSLGPCDRFSILAFDHSLEWFDGGKGEHRYIDATEQGIESGIRFLRELYARGGTDMLPAFEQAIELIRLESKGERIPVIVLVTDGQVGNEAQLLAFCQKKLGDTRTFTVGIDTAVNFGFLTRLAKLAGGTSAFAAPGAQLESALIGISREIGVPIVTELEIYSVNRAVKLTSFAPGRVPDLFAGRASDCFFRLTCSAKTTPRLTVKGKLADGSVYAQTIDVKETKFEAISRLWAREYIRELEDVYRVKPAKQEVIKKEIINLSTKFSVLCRFTAFTAIDIDEIVQNDGRTRQIVQPVHNPDSWHSGDQAAIGSFPCLNAGSTKSNYLMMCKARPSQFEEVSQASPDAYSEGSGNTRSENGPIFGLLPRLREASEQLRSDSPSPKKAKNSGSGVFGALDIWSRMKSVKSTDPSSSTPPTSPLARVETSLESFKKRWSEIWIMLTQGQIPDYKQLDEARNQLMDALTDHPIGFEVPLLQKQLRTSIKVYVSTSKNPDVSIAKLMSLYSGLSPEVEKALAETNKAMSKFRGRTGAFWETSV